MEFIWDGYHQTSYFWVAILGQPERNPLRSVQVTEKSTLSTPERLAIPLWAVPGFMSKMLYGLQTICETSMNSLFSRFKISFSSLPYQMPPLSERALGCCKRSLKYWVELRVVRQSMLTKKVRICSLQSMWQSCAIWLSLGFRMNAQATEQQSAPGSNSSIILSTHSRNSLLQLHSLGLSFLQVQQRRILQLLFSSYNLILEYYFFIKFYSSRVHFLIYSMHSLGFGTIDSLGKPGGLIEEIMEVSFAIFSSSSSSLFVAWISFSSQLWTFFSSSDNDLAFMELESSRVFSALRKSAIFLVSPSSSASIRLSLDLISYALSPGINLAPSSVKSQSLNHSMVIWMFLTSGT